MDNKKIFHFTDIGEGLHEGTIQEIKVKIGQKVNDGDPILSVQTDKVASDLPAPSSGIILKIYVKEGQVVHVGDPLVYIGDKDEIINETTSNNNAVKKNETNNVILQNKTTVIKEASEKTNEGASVVGEVKVSNKVIGLFGNQVNNSNSNFNDTYGSLSATPLARRTASKLRINLSQIIGTGPSGRIINDDILLFQRNRMANEINAFNIQKAKSEQVAVVLKPNDYSKPITQIRRQTATAMTNAQNNTVNTTLYFEVNITDLNILRNQFKNEFKQKYNANLTYLPFFIQAIALSLKKFPIFNAVYDSLNEEIVYRGDVNIGFAVDSPDGLFVPNIKNADNLTLPEIAQEVTRLAKDARNKKLAPTEMKNGTFTITNLGSIGAMFGFPIIFYPQIAIFGLGGTETKLYLDADGKVKSKDVMYFTVSADHKWIDGGDIGRFAQFVKDQIEFKFYERNFKNAK
ncbi:MAG: dihydrolipoamide acetyltransferase family protein [Mycoplasmoidaceae bacterium]